MQHLVKRAQRGDADAFVALIESSKQSMYKVAKGFFSNEDDVADAMADATLSAYEHLQELKHGTYFRTWLIRILINTCNQMLRERKRVTVVEEVPEAHAENDEYSDVEFRELLSSCPEDCRIIMLLYYGERLNTREIAEVLDLNENTVRSKLRRTRTQLQQVLCHE